MVLNPRRQLPEGLNTANAQYFDALIRHQIFLLRVSGSIRNEIYELLDATERDLRAQIRTRIRPGQGITRPVDVRRLEALLRALRATRLRSWDSVRARWVERLIEVANAEPEFLANALQTVSPVVINPNLPAPELLLAIVNERPFEGRILREWADDIQRADLQRIEDQIRIGLTQGESSANIARRVVGTASLRGRDGVTEITRRQAEAISRTAVNAITNQAKRAFYDVNSDVFDGELYVATLDERTTRICSSLDGQRFPVGEGPLPPLHFNCRSLRVPILDRVELGDRPAINVTQRQLLREYTESRNLRTVTRRADLPRGNKGRFDRFARTRKRQLIGQVPAKVSYQEWLGRQSNEFVDDVLGRTRGRLFREGNLPLTRFVNRAGDEIPLRELARREADAFRAAGLDPVNFTGG